MRMFSRLLILTVLLLLGREASASHAPPIRVLWSETAAAESSKSRSQSKSVNVTALPSLLPDLMPASTCLNGQCSQVRSTSSATQSQRTYSSSSFSSSRRQQRASRRGR